MFDSFFHDVRFAARVLRKNPGFTSIAIAMLALAIGANTAIFSVVDAVILRPLAYPDSARLFSVHEIVPRFSQFGPLIPVNAMHFREWRNQARSFDRLALIGALSLNLTGAGDPERIAAARVSPGLFPMLGIRTALGRTFLEEEDKPGRDQVVVLNDELWRRRFASDPHIIGRKIELSGGSYEVIGVLEPGIHFPRLSQLFAMTLSAQRPELWKPFAVRDDELTEMGDFNFVCLARLRRGVTASSALSELNVIQANFVRNAPFKVELRAALVPLQEQITSRSRIGLELVLAAVGAVLLIGCVNIANLLLARGISRRREMAIRSAIGASTARLLRQMLVESLLVSTLGGLAGVSIGYAAIGAILRLAPADLPRLDEVHLDARVLLFTATLSILSGLLCGLLPAWRFARGNPADRMNSGGRGATAGPGSRRLHALLVACETGLAALCLAAAGLLLHSFVKLLQVEKGFDVERVMTVELNPPSSRYPNLEKRAAFERALVDRVRVLPGVISAGVVNRLPLTGEGANNLLNVEGRNVPVMERPLADIRQVNPDYFRAMGIPLRLGRFFAESDRERRVALVSTLTAARVWPGENPIGKRFRVGGNSAPHEIVGVVGDIHGVSLNQQPSLTVYLPYWQANSYQVSLVVKIAYDPLAASSTIRGAIHEVDAAMPVPAFRAMQEIVSESVAQRRFQMRLLLLFAAAALLLASLGTYGAVSCSVAQRTNEVGIRMALGARPGAIAALVLRQGLMPVVAGLACGAVASVGLGRLLGSLLFSVGAADPVTLGAVVAVLGAVAVAAAYIPARRAARIDPVAALRRE